MTYRISNIGDETKFWFAASFFSLVILLFVITTPGSQNSPASPSGSAQAYSVDRSAADQTEIPFHPRQSFKYDQVEDLTYKDQIDNPIQDY